MDGKRRREMKKLLTIMAAALLAICCFGLVACGGGVEGTYKFKSMTAGGETYAVGDVAPWGEDGETISADYLVLELKSDGSVAYSMSMGGETESKTGTWAQDGNTITITIDDEAMPFTLDGKTLSYTYGEGQYSSTTVLEKA